LSGRGKCFKPASGRDSATEAACAFEHKPATQCTHDYIFKSTQDSSTPGNHQVQQPKDQLPSKLQAHTRRASAYFGLASIAERLLAFSDIWDASAGTCAQGNRLDAHSRARPWQT